MSELDAQIPTAFGKLEHLYLLILVVCQINCSVHDIQSFWKE